MQQLIESAQLDSPVDIPSLLRGSFDDELDLDDSVDTGSELLTPSSLGEGSEGGSKNRAARRHVESELDALRSENGALRRAALASESKRATEVQAYQTAMEASQQANSSTSTAVALVLPSPFDILPPPPPRARHLRNHRRLQRLSGQAGPWQAEVARQLGNEGFVALDSFLGVEGATRLRAAVVSALESAATAGGLSGGGAAWRLRGDRTLWAHSSVPLEQLLRNLDGLVAQALGPRLPGASDLQWRSDAQFSVYPANGSRYVRHVDNTCSDGRGKLCNGRRLSAVYYLNARWAPADGGELRILRQREQEGEMPEIDISPEMDRLLLFWADSRTPHEALHV